MPDDISARTQPIAADVPLIPLDAALALNDRFVGTVSVEVSVDGSQGVIDADAFVALVSPLLHPSLAENLSKAIGDSDKISFAQASSAGVAVSFDAFALQINAFVAAGDLGTTVLPIRPRGVAPEPTTFDQPSNLAVGLNVALEQAVRHYGDAGPEALRATLEGSINIGGFDGLTLYSGATRSAEGWRRLPITMIHDDFDRAIRYTAGEIVPLTSGFQRAPRLLGAGVFRAYGTIRPFETIRQVGRRSFVLEQTSEARIYSNGVLAETVRLDAGSYELSDFPLTAGGNDVVIEVTDISGNVTAFDFDLFSDAQLLEQGIIEFGAYVGLPETGQLQFGDDVVGTAFVRAGVVPNLTLGAHGQLGTAGQMIGATVRFGSVLGFAEIEAALSQRDVALPLAAEPEEATGVSVSFDVRRSLNVSAYNLAQINGNVTFRSADFGDPFSLLAADPFRWNGAVRASIGLPYGIGAGVGGTYTYGGAHLVGQRVPRSWSADVSLTKSFGNVRIGATYGLRSAPDRDAVADQLGFGDENTLDHRVTFTLTATPGRSYNVGARYDSSSDATRIDARRLGRDELGNVSGAFGLTDRPGATEVRLDAAYIQNRGRFELQHDHLFATGQDGRDNATTRLRLASFAGFAGGKVGIGRPANAGFVIAPVHSTLDEADVSIVNGERIVARAGILGPPVVPLDRSYSLNRFGLEVAPLPPGYDLGTGSIQTFPSSGVGYTAQIGSEASRIALGFIVGPEGPIALAAGYIRPAGEPEAKGRAFFTNRGGRFVADGLAPGRYEAWIDGRIVTSFEIPAKSEGMVDVGTLQAE